MKQQPVGTNEQQPVGTMGTNRNSTESKNEEFK